MRTLLSGAMMASVFGLFAGSATAADLDYPPPPPPAYDEPHPVPPAFVPGPVPPVYYRAPVLYPPRVVYPRPIIRPYLVYGPGVRGYGGPGPYADGYERLPPPRESRPYGEPGFDRGYPRDADLYRRDREEHGGYDGGGYDRGGLARGGPERGGYDRDRGYERQGDRGDDRRYGHYLSRDELQRRAEREQGYGDRGDARDHFADREPGPRDVDR